MQNNCSNSEVEYAGFWVRLAAYLIDSLVVFTGLLGIRLIFLVISGLVGDTVLTKAVLFRYTLKDIILYAGKIVYFVLLTYYTGTTLGKRLMNLRVVGSGENGQLTLWSILYRETVGRFLSASLLGIGYLMAAADREKRGLHDRLADTKVIYAKKVTVYAVNVPPVSAQPVKETVVNDEIENRRETTIENE